MKSLIKQINQNLSKTITHFDTNEELLKHVKKNLIITSLKMIWQTFFNKFLIKSTMLKFVQKK